MSNILFFRSCGSRGERNVQIPMSNEGFWSIKKFGFRPHKPVSTSHLKKSFGPISLLETKFKSSESWEPEAEKRYKHAVDMAGHIEKILPEIRPQYAINDRAQRIRHLPSGSGHWTFIFP